jgi:demethylmenaquinone methyltransferase/2-methoxy-6-polyprenyl-1,4-benzoquinol methylase
MLNRTLANVVRSREKMSNLVLPPPDEVVRALSLAKYRKRAARYDSTCGPTWPIRERAVAALNLQPGQAVLDVGCGTGLSLALLREAVGEQGRIYGFDQSPEMLAQARQRTDAAGWCNVELFECPAQILSLPAPVDAILFHYTHDILRSPLAVHRLLAGARHGAAVAIAGVKFFPRWMAPLNIWVYLKNHGYNGSPGELTAPWDRIAPHLSDWQMTPTQFGMGYLAFGRVNKSAQDEE